MQYYKVYVKVFLEVDTDGKIIPLQIEWMGGRRFDVGRLVRVERRPSRCGGLPTDRYEIRIGTHSRFLFRELTSNRWFVEAESAPPKVGDLF